MGFTFNLCFLISFLTCFLVLVVDFFRTFVSPFGSVWEFQQNNILIMRIFTIINYDKKNES